MAKSDFNAFTFTDSGFFTYKAALVVPNTNNLQTKLLTKIYARLPTAYLGRNKTRQLVKPRYWWPDWSINMDQYVANY